MFSIHSMEKQALPLRIWFLFLSLVCSSAAADPTLQLASIGNLNLSSGDTLLDAKVGYRTAGTLNEDKSNVIIFLTWFTGTTEDLFSSGQIGSGKMADTDRYFVIAIDALGNGVSSSPSNSPMQPDKQFPRISMADMVNSQHVLLTRHLGIDHAVAVIGISMGGMQTYHWMGQFPGFMDKAIPIIGTPKATSYDLLQWQTQEQAIIGMQDAGVENSEITEFLNWLGLMTLWTPGYFVENVSVENLPQFVEDFGQGHEKRDANDYLTQLRAMIDVDVYMNDTVSKVSYQDRVRAEVLVINSASDHTVNPNPGKTLSESIGAKYVEIDSICGHMGTACESDRVNQAVRAFLGSSPTGQNRPH